VLSQILRAADIAQSCLFGLRSNEIATADLQMEWQTRGYSDRLIGDSVTDDGNVIFHGQTIKARRGFLDFVAYGEVGPQNVAVKALGGRSYTELYGDTKRKLLKLTTLPTVA
jgi:hypothetical protein